MAAVGATIAAAHHSDGHILDDHHDAVDGDMLAAARHHQHLEHGQDIGYVASHVSGASVVPPIQLPTGANHTEASTVSRTPGATSTGTGVSMASRLSAARSHITDEIKKVGKGSYICYRLEEISKEHFQKDVCRDWLDMVPVLNTIAVVIIILQALEIGFEVHLSNQFRGASTMPASSHLSFFVLQIAFAAFFFAEIIVRMCVRIRSLGCRHGLCFWSKALFLDVAVTLCSIAGVLVHALDTPAHGLELVPLLRLTRVFYWSKTLYTVVKGTTGAVRGSAETVALILIVCWGGALLVAQYTLCFPANVKRACLPNGTCMDTYFRTVGDSYLTHVAWVLGDGWADIAAPMRVDSEWWSIYVVVFVYFSHLGLLNVVVSIVCQQMNAWTQAQPSCTHEEALEKKSQKDGEMERLFMSLTAGGDQQTLRTEQYLSILKSPAVFEFLQSIKVNLPLDAEQLVSVIDSDGKGSITCQEWKEGLQRLRGSRGDVLSLGLQSALHDAQRQTKSTIAQAQDNIREAMKTHIFQAGLILSQDLAATASLIRSRPRSPSPPARAPPPPPPPLPPAPPPPPPPRQDPVGLEDALSELMSSQNALDAAVSRHPLPPPALGLETKDIAIQTDEFPPWEEGFGTELTLQPERQDVLRASGFAMPSWALGLFSVLENTLPSSRAGSARSQDHHDDFLYRLSHNQLHEEDIHRLTRAGHSEHHTEVGLSRRARIFGSPATKGHGVTALTPLKSHRRAASPGPSPVVSPPSTSWTTRRLGRFGGAGSPSP